MAKASALVTVDNISLKLSGKNILQGVSLSISEGEIVTIIGPNGAGKSSLVKTILGIHKPTTGSITKLKNLNIGYVPQKLAFDQRLPLTVERLLNLHIKTTKDALAKALSLTKVSHLIKEDVHRLSGGELQRVLLARAILQQPKLLVLDEPTQGVDFHGETELYQLIQTIRDQLGCGVLMISHDLHVVMAATDHVICLNGHVCCDGAPESITQHPDFIELFGTNHSVGFYTHNHDHDHDIDGKVKDCNHG